MDSTHCAEKAPGSVAHPYYFGARFCRSWMPFPEKQREPLDRVQPYSAGGARWKRKTRHDLWTGNERSTKTADCYLCAQRAMVGSALAALPRIVTEIDDVAPAHSRTYRNIVSAVGVLCADRMSLFIKKFSSDACFQQGPRRISGESLQDRHNPNVTTRQT